jgi:hypothetical protein
MKRIPMIRFATYLVFIAILLSAQNQVRVIPVALSDPDLRDAAVEAESRLKLRLEEIDRIVNSDGFLGAKRSGAELFAIASRAAAGYGAKLSDFHQPEVRVKLMSERLKWILVYVRDYGPNGAFFPAETFSVTIDDESGVASVKNETARM